MTCKVNECFDFSLATPKSCEIILNLKIYLNLLVLLAGAENSIIRAASTSDFCKRVTGKEGVKKRWEIPLLLFMILFKGLNLNFTTFVENSVWVFFYTKMWFIGMRSRASHSISALRGRRGRYAHAYGICAPFYCFSPKIIYGWGYNAARNLISRDTALHTHFRFTPFLVSILSYPFIKT